MKRKMTKKMVSGLLFLMASLVFFVTALFQFIGVTELWWLNLLLATGLLIAGGMILSKREPS